jgi:dihydrofolate reductase
LIILWGSSTLTPMLLEHGLADEVLLFVYPVLLGKGTLLFRRNSGARTRAHLDETCFLWCDHQHLHTGLTFADRILLRNGSVSQYRSPERDSEATLINPVKSASVQ